MKKLFWCFLFRWRWGVGTKERESSRKKERVRERVKELDLDASCDKNFIVFILGRIIFPPSFFVPLLLL